MLTKRILQQCLCIVIVIGLAACGNQPIALPTDTSIPISIPPTITSTPSIPVTVSPSPTPTQPFIPMNTPNAVQVERWQDYEIALAKAFFSSLTPDIVVCEWDILGYSDNQIYVWAVCDALEGGRKADGSAVIFLSSNEVIENVKILGKNSNYISDIASLPVDIQQKLNVYGGANILEEHLIWRQTHPEEPPLVILSATPIP